MFHERSAKRVASKTLTLDDTVPDSDENPESGEIDIYIFDWTRDEPQPGLSGNTGYITSHHHGHQNDQKTGGDQLELSLLNQFLTVSKFKMALLESIRS